MSNRWINKYGKYKFFVSAPFSIHGQKHGKRKRKTSTADTELGRILYMHVSMSVNMTCTLQSSIKIELW